MFTRYQMEEIAVQLDAAALHSGDMNDTAAKMLRQCARTMPQPSDPAWQQELQADQVRLGMMPDTNPPYNVQNVGTDDMGQSEPAPADATVDPPSSEEPTA